MDGPSATFQSVLRILLEEDQVNAWLVQWLRPTTDVDSFSELESGPNADRQAVKAASSADSEFLSDIDVHRSFGEYITPQEVACLPHLPRPEDMNCALIWDLDLDHLDESHVGVMIPMSDDSGQNRFVNAVMMSNASVNPFPKGVFVLPGHRATAFRTRYGFAWITVGFCTDGSVYITLSRIWDNLRCKIQAFHTKRIEYGAKLLSYAIVERRGLCVQACGSGRCDCWRPQSSRRGDAQLAMALTWSEFAPLCRDALRAARIEKIDMQCASFFGNGQLAFRVDFSSRFEATLGGTSYPNMSQLKFLFFDRLTTASSVRHSQMIDWETASHCERSTLAARSTLSHADSEPLDGDQNDISASSVGVAGSRTHGFPCLTCGKVFGRRSDRGRHIKTIHQNVHKFLCEECGRRFKQGSHLLTHVRAVHEKRRDFKCAICTAAFSVFSNWKRHMRAVHPNHAVQHASRQDMGRFSSEY
ncbi:Zinc finger and BTB domain-containing protein 44 [Porphyridium purpureum]|uniref:Zinc finger and BTB domain-containing protein 44 n=1 Tax=Porphyridium purpureum TaxID=35688 RepID=A0A5J4YJA1_PORPP|nr:Zinc finger and BTB domain-containing protein 44 [Porphyridium purpureum]|eukprot:POR3086..scf297_16